MFVVALLITNVFVPITPPLLLVPEKLVVVIADNII